MSLPAVDWSELSLQVTITFGHFLWQACVVAILFAICEQAEDFFSGRARALRSRAPTPDGLRRSANIRYTIVCLTFFSLPICVVTTFAWVHQSRGPILLAANETAESITSPVVVAHEPTPSVVNKDVAVLPSLEMAAKAELPSIEPLEVPSTAPPASLWTERLHSSAPYLLIAYSIGVAFLLTRFGLSIVGSSRLRRTLQPITDSNLLNIIVEQSSRLGLQRIPVVALCQRLSVPVVVGIVKPMILLPPALLSGLDPNQLAAILSHEMAHIRRYDLVVNLLQRIVEAFLFFHPVTWWISRRIRIERENCCDDMAAGGCGRIEYAAALLRMAEQCAAIRGLKIAPQLESLAADGGNTSQLGYRIRRLLGEDNTPRVSLTRNFIAAIALAMVVAGLSIVTIAHAGPELQIADPAAENDQNPPEEKSSKTSSADEQSEAGRFTGIVNGPDGEPFAGAEIYLVSNKGDAQKLGAVRAVTDATGRFDFVAADMTYAGYDGSSLTHEALIFAVARGFGPDWMEVWGDTTSRLIEYWTPRKGAKIELQLAKADVTIRGQFLDADGKPLVGARVRLTGLMVPRERDLTKHLDHWSKASVSAGFLTKVPDYKRELIRTELLPDIRTETRTDADGRFEFSGPGRDRLTRIQVTAPSVLTTTIEVMTRQADNVGTFLDFDGKPTQTVYGSEFSLRLNKGLTVRGIVRDQETKQPIAGMWVTKDYNPLTQPRWTRDVPISDENGRFTISGLNPKLLDYEEVRVRRFTAMPQPGIPYLQARAAAVKDEELVIECVRGIPFRLKVVDEAGKPVEAEVEYWSVNPNPLSKDLVLAQMEGTNWPVMNRAARRDDGSYEGFALPGPGAVIIKSSDRYAYRPAFVDPKSFFEPGRIDWPEDADNTYGTTDTLVTYGQRVDQNRVHAIELVNPAADSESLELSTTLVPDRPRKVTLVGPDDNPVTGVDSRMRWPDRETKELLSSSTFTLKGLHPKRVKTMIFYAEDQSLIGRLDVRGDDDSPIAVRMLPWSTLTGRVLDVTGKPLQGFAYVDDERILTAIDKGGKFRFSKLVPGHTYRLTIRRKDRTLVRTIDHVVLHSGEPRDLGDIRIGDANAAASQPHRPDDKYVRSGSGDSTESQTTEFAKPASQQRAGNDQSSWIPARPIKTSLSTEGTAKILEDNSLRLEGDARWQEVSLQFEFEKPTSVEEICLEILPVDSPAGPQFGRGGNKLMLFDVKPSIEDQAGKFTSLDFSSCTYLQNPSDETTADCIDHLSDTGWNVPNLPADATSHELVLRVGKPITLRAGQRLTLTVDSGGSDELAVLNCIRFAFHQAVVSKPADDQEENAIVPPGLKTGTVVLHAIDADSGEPIPNVTFVIENLKAEEWAAPVGKSGHGGTRQLETEPKPGCFFSVHPVPDGYQVTGLDEVPAGVVVGGRVEHRFHLRKRGAKNADFPDVLPTPETSKNQLPVPSELTKSGSIRSSVDNMPGFAGQQIQFVYHPSRTEMAERVFHNGRRVRAALDNELEYFRKAEGEKAGDVTEISDVMIAIQANRQWVLRCRTKDGMKLRDGFNVHFNDLESWDLKVPAYVHPEF